MDSFKIGLSLVALQFIFVIVIVPTTTTADYVPNAGCSINDGTCAQMSDCCYWSSIMWNYDGSVQSCTCTSTAPSPNPAPAPSPTPAPCVTSGHCNRVSDCCYSGSLVPPPGCNSTTRNNHGLVGPCGIQPQCVCTTPAPAPTTCSNAGYSCSQSSDCCSGSNLYCNNGNCAIGSSPQPAPAPSPYVPNAGCSINDGSCTQLSDCCYFSSIYWNSDGSVQSCTCSSNPITY